VSVNTWSKALNAFLAWLHAEGHVPERREIARLKTEKRVLVLLSTEQLKRVLVRHVPRAARILVQQREDRAPRSMP
jgi:hypothetical protein